MNTINHKKLEIPWDPLKNQFLSNSLTSLQLKKKWAHSENVRLKKFINLFLDYNLGFGNYVEGKDFIVDEEGSSSEEGDLESDHGEDNF